MGYGAQDPSGNLLKSDGADKRAVRIRDLVLMVVDNPGYTFDQAKLLMLAVGHGLDDRTLKKYFDELVRMQVFEVKSVKLAEGENLGVGYYPLTNAKMFYGERKPKEKW